MASFLVVVSASVLLIAAILQFAGKRALSCWLLVPFPVIACFRAIAKLSHGSRELGESTFEGDLTLLVYLAAPLLLSLLAALRPNWQWMFWIAWVLNALVCAFVVFIAFFWKVFS